MAPLWLKTRRVYRRFICSSTFQVKGITQVLALDANTSVVVAMAVRWLWWGVSIPPTGGKEEESWLHISL